MSGSVAAGPAGIHSNVTTFAFCKCGNTNAPPTLSSPYPTGFTDSDVKFDWTFGDKPKVEGYGMSFSGTKSVSAPGPYTLTANFKGTRAGCTRCTCEAGASTNCTVYRLKVTAEPFWLGLDRTGTNANVKTGTGTADLQPSAAATYKWSHSGVCRLVDTNIAVITYRTQDKESCSGSYGDQTLTAIAAITLPQPFSLSATTNFTVVKVDVTIDGLNEEKEEKVGACLEYQADATNDIWTAVGTSALKGVSINCWPLDLPATEMVKIEAPDGFLYEKVGEEYTRAQTSYKACEVGQKQFFLHGHVTSGGMRDGSIIVTHENSAAKDMAKFTVFDVLYKNKSLSEKSLMVFYQDGVSSDGLRLQPDPQPINVSWTVEGLPSEGTEIRWSSSTGYPEIGSGCAPSLYVKYVMNSADPTDKMPPDNRWFGKKGITVGIGEMLIISRPVTFCFNSNAESKLLNNNKVAAWYYYYIRAAAVSGLQEFNYVDVIGQPATDGSAVQAKWRIWYNDFQIARAAILHIQKAVIVDNKYTETDYENFLGWGCHGVAKICEHEKWHKQLASEIRVVIHPLPNGGHYETNNDAVGDGLTDERELEIESDPTAPDSFEFGPYSSGQDEEVFCRLMQKALGVESLDWFITGPQVQKISKGIQ